MYRINLVHPVKSCTSCLKIDLEISVHEESCKPFLGSYHRSVLVSFFCDHWRANTNPSETINCPRPTTDQRSVAKEATRHIASSDDASAEDRHVDCDERRVSR